MVAPATPDGQSVASSRSSKKKSSSGTTYKPPAPSTPWYADLIPDAEKAVAQTEADFLSQYGGTEAPEPVTVGPWTNDGSLPGETSPLSLSEDEQLELLAEDPAVVSARAKLDDALRFQRAHAIGMDKGYAPKPIKKQVDKLTSREYNNMTPLQRAAVDYNTKLVKAVKTDRRLQDEYELDDMAQDTYDASVTKMFGDDGGSTTMAPATVEFLKTIGFSDESADLDDFLQLKASIKNKDLKSLTKKAQTAPSHPLQSPTTGRGMLQEDKQGLIDALSQGSLWKKETEMAPVFEGYISTLGREDADPVALLAALRSDMPTDELRAFREFASEQLETGKIGVEPGVKYRKPEELLKIIRSELNRDMLKGGGN